MLDHDQGISSDDLDSKSGCYNNHFVYSRLVGKSNRALSLSPDVGFRVFMPSYGGLGP
jgi:hypothetical protein